MALSAEGQTLASGSLDNSIKLWSVRSRSLAHTIADVHALVVRGVAVAIGRRSSALWQRTQAR